jgi:hypothetical protein
MCFIYDIWNFRKEFDSSQTSGIVKKGLVKLTDSLNQREIKLVGYLNQTNAYSSVGNIVCNELGFNKSVIVSTKAVTVDALTADSSSSSIGVLCSGAEGSLKECKAFDPVAVASNLVQLEIECLCKFLLY